MQAFISSLKKKDFPFVLFRSPEENEIHCYFQEDNSEYRTEHFKEEGFVFGKFVGEESSLYIPATHATIISNKAPLKSTLTATKLPLEGKNSFQQKVEKAIEEINTTSLEKVVLSAPFSVPTEREGGSLFAALEKRYPNAFVYYWSHPKSGDWLGATPEQFISLEANALKTMSLAGTIPLEANQDTWTEKEYHEQELVTAHIVKALKRVVTTSAIRVGERQTIRAGKLQHLRTLIQLSVEKTSLSSIIDVLHPTPAVGGLPVVDAQSFIKAHEGYDRMYYSGFLGTFKQNENAQLYVNLRCGKLSKKGLQLFAGAGITSGSDPSQEWNEICRKAMTFLSVL